MLSAQAYSFHQKAKLAISLSWIGGYVDAAAFLVCGWFTSHMSGNSTGLGKTLAQYKTADAGVFAFLLTMFFIGAVVSAVLTEGARVMGMRSKYIAPMAAEALILVVFGLCVARYADGTHGRDALFFVLAGSAAMAMGVQNATITAISGAVVRTTHVTGVVTDLGLEGVQYLFWYGQKSRGRELRRDGRLLALSTRHPTVLRLALLASIIVTFILGAAVGTLMFVHAVRWVALPPIAFLLFILIRDWLKPIADVREIDLLSDPELKAAGIVHSLLPKELGICRMAEARRGHRAPNFQAWTQRLPPRWRVVILVMQPTLRLNENALMDFEQAIRWMNAKGRSVVLCGVNRSQYSAMERAGLIPLIGWENLCPDMEFAVSRGMNLLGTPG